MLYHHFALRALYFTVIASLSTSCQREAVSPTLPSTAPSSAGRLVFKTYDQLTNHTNELTAFFSSKGSYDGPASTDYSQISKSDFKTLLRSKELARYDNFMRKFPQLAQYNTVYAYYIDLLRKDDEERWQIAVQDFPDLFYTSNIDGALFLKHTALISSMIDLSGTFLVESELVVYGQNVVRVYDSLNYSLSADTIMALGRPHITLDNGTAQRPYYYDQVHYLGNNPSANALYRTRFKGVGDWTFAGLWNEMYAEVASYPQRKFLSDCCWYSFAPKEQYIGVGRFNVSSGTGFDDEFATFYNSTSSWVSGHIANVPLTSQMMWQGNYNLYDQEMTHTMPTVTWP